MLGGQLMLPANNLPIRGRRIQIELAIFLLQISLHLM
jgi:hypothetical protein